MAPSGTDTQGNPIYAIQRPGYGFVLVIEGRPGTSRSPLGSVTFNSVETDPAARPDLQIVAARALGNGSAAVCDNGPPPPNAPLGGVPASDFGPSQQVANAMNDLACRFEGREESRDACTLNRLGLPGFVASGTTEQFCAVPAVGHEIEFPPGDTIVGVQLRDDAKNIGDRRAIVVRVQ